MENGKAGCSAVSWSPLVAGRGNVSIVVARIERDCKFISERRASQRTYAQLFLLFAYFFLDEARLSPFVLKWTSCHYTPCYCYFFRRFYRVLRGEGVPFGKMFVLRASVLESLRVEWCRRRRWKMSYEILFQFFPRCIFRLSGLCCTFCKISLKWSELEMAHEYWKSISDPRIHTSVHTSVLYHSTLICENHIAMHGIFFP